MANNKKTKLINKIDELLTTHKEGGEVFFDHLDEAIRSKKVLKMLWKSVPEGLRYKNIIVSGRFGKVFQKHFGHLIDNLIVVEGGLRNGDKTINLIKYDNFIFDQSFTFIDDSFYSGSTRNTISKELERLGGKLHDTYVVYDGSREKDWTVFSMYRYYGF